MIGRESGESLASVMRSFSVSFFTRQVYQLHQQEREKERREAADLQRWTKMGSFRRGRGLKQICHSHESLAVEAGEEGALRLGAATSVHSVAAAVAAAGGAGRAEGGDASRIAGWAVNFQRLLQDPAGRQVFTEFLRKEFSEENILFWQACENFKEIEDDEERRRRAAEIFEQHLAMRAAEPVNVDSQARQSALELLDSAPPDTFSAAQMQVFQLMKQDSYARFLKSDCYKTFLMREMEGKPLELPQPVLSPRSRAAKAKEEKKKKGKENKEEKGKRRSILPWRQKDKKSKAEGKAGKEVNNNKKQQQAGVDLAALRRETIPARELEPPDEAEEDPRFCRVILPDGSTTVVCARNGMTARSVLGKLCEKRGISIAAVDVFLTGADKPLDLSEDSGKLGSREVTIERRVLFRMDLPSKKSIGVKAKPNRTVRDVFKPILAKYGHRIDDCNVQISGHSEFLDLESLVSVLDNERVIVMPASSSETGRRGPARRSRRGSLEEVTNGIFEALMLGKSHLAHSFDELGTVDLDTGKGHKSRGEPPSLGLFGGRAKKEASKENRKQKGRNQVTFALQRNEVKLRPKDNDDEFFELLSRVQGQRLEDQRGPWAGSVLELPDFLQLQSRRRSLERSVSASDLFDEVCYMRGNSFHSLQPGHLFPNLLGFGTTTPNNSDDGQDGHLSSAPQRELAGHLNVSGLPGRAGGHGCSDGGTSSDSPSSRPMDPSTGPELQAWSDSSPALPMEPVVVDMAEENGRDGGGGSGEGQGKAGRAEARARMEAMAQVPLASPEKFSPGRPGADPGRDSNSSFSCSKSQGADSGKDKIGDFDQFSQFAESSFSAEVVAPDQAYPHRSGFRRVSQGGGAALGEGAGGGRLTTGHSGDPSIVQAELSVDRLAAGIPARSAPWQQAGRAPSKVTSTQLGQRTPSRPSPSRSASSDLCHCPAGEESSWAEARGSEQQQSGQGAVQGDLNNARDTDREKELEPRVSNRERWDSKYDSSRGQIVSNSKAARSLGGRTDAQLSRSDGPFPEHSSLRPKSSWHSETSGENPPSAGGRLAKSSGQTKDLPVYSELEQERRDGGDSSQVHGASSTATCTPQKQISRESSSSSTDKKGTTHTARESNWRRALHFLRSSGSSNLPQTARDQQPRAVSKTESPPVLEETHSSQMGLEHPHRRLPPTPSAVDHKKSSTFSATEPQQQNSSSASSPAHHRKSSPLEQYFSHVSKTAGGGMHALVTGREQQRNPPGMSSPPDSGNSSSQQGGSYWQTPQFQTFRGPNQTDLSMSTFKTHSANGFGEVTADSPGALQQQAGSRDGAAPTTRRLAFVSHSGPFHLSSSNIDPASHQSYSKQIQHLRETHSQGLSHPLQGAVRGGRDGQAVDAVGTAQQNIPSPDRHFSLHNSSNETHPPYPSPNPSGSGYLGSSFQNGSRDYGDGAGFVEETVTFV